MKDIWRVSVAALALGTTLVGGIGAVAQTPASTSGARFEVASVKPNRSADPHGTVVVQPGGRYTAVNVPVQQLIMQAYDLQSGQLVGGPDWTRTDRFDITAKADGELQPTGAGDGPGAGRLQQMLQALMADRFALVVHRESRELPTYQLLRAGSDNTLGPKMRVSTTDCVPQSAATRGRAGGPPPGPPGANLPVTCGVRLGHGQLWAGEATMAQLAVSLSTAVQRVVHDRTGLMGRYTMEMSFTPERMPQGLPIDPDGTSIFTALQEQLGLKLSSARAPVEVVIIDSIARATAD